MISSRTIPALRSQRLSRIAPGMHLPSQSRHLSSLPTISQSLSSPIFRSSSSIHQRNFHKTSTMSASKKDWSAAQYLKFGNERTRAAYDLVSRVQTHLSPSVPLQIYDLGCGPGNSTRSLLHAFPNAHITGLDTSPDMLAKARTELPEVQFEKGDVSAPHLDIDSNTDLLFSNAVFHWLRQSQRIPTLERLFSSLKPGAVLAIQMPDNYNELSHALMRAIAISRSKAPWTPFFEDCGVGDLSCASRPDLDPIEPPHEYYNALAHLAQSVDIWRTTYVHVLADAAAIVEWVKGTGLQPFLQRIQDEGAKEAFLKEYERALKEAYPPQKNGKVLLGYPRLFVVAVRK